MKLLSLDLFYIVAGIFILLVAGRAARDRAHPKRWGTAAFWGLLALTFLAGKALPPVVVGYFLLVMVGLTAMRQVGERVAPSPSHPPSAWATGSLGPRC